MSWADDLWDQIGSLSNYSQISIKCLEEYGTFLERRSSIEGEYASKLQRLATDYGNRINRINERNRGIKELSWHKSLIQVLETNLHLANQHAIVANGLQNLVVGQIRPDVTRLREEKKGYLQEMEQRQENLKDQMSLFAKQMARYKKVHIEDNQLEKRDCERALRSVLDRQKEHYDEKLPELLQKLQEWDEKRIKTLQNYFEMSTLTDRNIIPVVEQCLNDIEETQKSIDHKKDALAVIEIYKSGYFPPRDISFTSLREKMDAVIIEEIGIYDPPLPKMNPPRGLPRLYRSFTPYQQIKACDEKLCFYQNKISIETSALSALTKMMAIFVKDRTIGDLKHIESQISVRNRSLANYEAKINKYKQIRVQLEQFYEFLSIQKYKESIPNIPNHIDPDIIPPEPSPHAKVPIGEIKLRPEEEDLQKWISDKGNCSALYPFGITSDGKINVSQGNEFWIIEEKGDSGWLTVKKVLCTDTKMENVIPIDYLERRVLLDQCFLELISKNSSYNALYLFDITSERKMNVLQGNEFWIIEEKDDSGWLTVKKDNRYTDREMETMINIDCLEKFVLRDSRFLVLET